MARKGAKCRIVAEEADETQGWLEFIRDANLLSVRKMESLISEANELTAIFSASVGTARANESKRKG